MSTGSAGMQIPDADVGIEANELRDAARRVLQKMIDRQAMCSAENSVDTRTLRATLAELGWMVLCIPVERGGLGQSLVSLEPIYCEIGRALAPTELFGSMATVDVLAAVAENPAANALLEAIGAGAAVVAVASGEPAWTTGDTQQSPPTVSGRLQSVLDAASATHLLVLPQPDSGQPLALVDLAGEGVSVQRARAWDTTRTLADVTLTGASAWVLARSSAASELSLIARAHLDLAIACDSVGGGSQLLEETVGYLLARRQFNRPIGSFQALKHRCADLKVALELARALTHEACEAYAARREDWSSLAAQAKLLASGAYRAIAEESIQLHGGIGFTWEHSCHLFLKRALLNEMLGGTPEHYKDRIATSLLAWTVRER